MLLCECHHVVAYVQHWISFIHIEFQRIHLVLYSTTTSLKMKQIKRKIITKEKLRNFVVRKYFFIFIVWTNMIKHCCLIINKIILTEMKWMKSKLNPKLCLLNMTKKCFWIISVIHEAFRSSSVAGRLGLGNSQNISDR